MIARRLKIFTYYSFNELAILFIGKALRAYNWKRFNDLQDRENKLSILLSASDELQFEDGVVRFSYKINNRWYKFALRLDGSDISVFRQIILGKEYLPAIECFQRNFGAEPNTMVDAGANIGMTSVFFSAFFPKIHVCLVEPDVDNLSLAEQHLNLNGIRNATLLKAALWSENGKFALVNDFRDRVSWSLRVKPDEGGSVSSVTPEEIIHNGTDIFKIDVEGAEGEIFHPANDVSWLNRIKLISIEIHKEVVNERVIFDRLIEHGFTLENYGELVIGINSKLVSK